MQKNSKNKLKSVLGVLLISNSFSLTMSHAIYADPSSNSNGHAVVEDRSIVLDSDVNNNNTPVNKFRNNINNLPQTRNNTSNNVVKNTWSEQLAYTQQQNTQQNSQQDLWKDQLSANSNNLHSQNNQSKNQIDNQSQDLGVDSSSNQQLALVDNKLVETEMLNQENTRLDTKINAKTNTSTNNRLDSTSANTNTIVSYNEYSDYEVSAGSKLNTDSNFYATQDANMEPLVSFDDTESSSNPEAELQERQRILKELQSMSVTARLQRLENIMEMQKSIHLDNKVKALQEENQRLRGLLEAQSHKLEKSIAQQKLLYEDLDRRFNQVNTSSSVAVDDISTNTASSSNSLAAKQFNYHDEKLAQQDLYTKAYRNIKSRDYNKAIELFEQYLENYPKGLFAANANYWLGEIYMIQSNYEKALGSFDKVLSKYPSSTKSADALYKKALVHIYLKDFDKAKGLLTEVKQKHANSTAARLADRQLRSLENLSSDS